MAASPGLFGMGTAGTVAVVVAALAGVGYVGYEAVQRMQPPHISIEAQDTTRLAAAAPEPAADPTDSEPAAQAQVDATEPAMQAPAFDIVRVDPDGTSVVAGTAEPGSDVQLFLDGEFWEKTGAGPEGKFALFVLFPPTDNPRLLTLYSSLGDREAWAEDQIIIAPAVPDVPEDSGETVAEAALPDLPEAEAEAPVETLAESDVPETVMADNEVPETEIAEIEDPAAQEPQAEPVAMAATEEEAAPLPPEDVLAEEVETADSEPAQVEDPVSILDEQADQVADASDLAEPVVQAEAQDLVVRSAEIQTEIETAPAQIADLASLLDSQDVTETETVPDATEEVADAVTSDTPDNSEGAVPQVSDIAPVTQDMADPPTALASAEPTTAPDVQANTEAAPQIAAATPIAPVSGGAVSPPGPDQRPAPLPPRSADPVVSDAPVASVAPDAPETDPNAPVQIAALPDVPRSVEPGSAPATEVTPAPRPRNEVTPAVPNAPAAPQTPAEETRDFASAPPTPSGPAGVSVIRAGKDGIELLQPGTPQRPEALDRLALDTISYSEAGDVQLSGRAPDGSAVRVYLDNKAVADLPIDPDGRWRGELAGITPGVYTLRLDQVANDGSVGGRLETPFKREAPAILEAARADIPPDRPSISIVTVQRGDTLWAISQSNYGSGFMYVRVFEANRDSIRDPDLIYPGQIFTIPN